MKILLINYNHIDKVKGGCETMYNHLHNIFPNSELISLSQFKGENLKEKSKELDEYLLERNKKEKIFVIKEAEFGGVLDTSMIPQINIFQNPFVQISNKFNIGYDSWIFEPKKISGKKITVSNYMKEVNNLDAEVVPNCVDTNFFNKLDKNIIKNKYNIPEGQRVGIWIGSPTPIKNFQMMLNLMEYFNDIFWILISKEHFNSPYKNSKVFCNVDKEIVRDLLNCSDFFILTSPIESGGISTMESMSCDVPCIVSKTGYFWDFFNKNIGIQINDPDDFKAHKDAINLINEIKTSPRTEILNSPLDLLSYSGKWKRLIEEVLNGRI